MGKFDNLSCSNTYVSILVSRSGQGNIAWRVYFQQGKFYALFSSIVVLCLPSMCLWLIECLTSSGVGGKKSFFTGTRVRKYCSRKSYRLVLLWKRLEDKLCTNQSFDLLLTTLATLKHCKDRLSSLDIPKFYCCLIRPGGNSIRLRMPLTFVYLFSLFLSLSLFFLSLQSHAFSLPFLLVNRLIKSQDVTWSKWYHVSVGWREREREGERERKG